MASDMVEIAPAKKLRRGSLKYPEEKEMIPPMATRTLEDVSKICPVRFQHFLALILDVMSWI